jgi:hypothetical protein
MRWMKHAPQHWGEGATVIHAKFGNLKWKRTPGRPSCRLKIVTTIDLEELEWTGFI